MCNVMEDYSDKRKDSPQIKLLEKNKIEAAVPL